MEKRIAILGIMSILFITGMVIPVVSAGIIAFETDRDGNYEIYRMNTDGTRQINLTNNPANDIQPALSPDGTKILFVSDRGRNGDIYVMNTHGTELRRLTKNRAEDLRPAWSPDGTKIAFESNRDGNDEIYVMNADGTGQTRITNNPARDFGAAWSPDGTKIAFGSDRSGVFYQIYVMNTDGTGVTQLTYNPPVDPRPVLPDLLNDMDNWNPDWSPDGSKIIFTSSHHSSSYIYRMNADGSAQTQIPGTNHGLGADWSPDGSKIAFYSDWDGVYYQIYVIRPDGTDRSAITSTDADNKNPSWNGVVIPGLIARVRILPDPLNIYPRGYFLAFVTLPESYKASDVDTGSVVCEGAQAVRLLRVRAFPQTFAAVFSREKLANVKPGDAVPFTVMGTVHDNGQNVPFSGTTYVKVVSKTAKSPETINGMITLTDNRIFERFYPG